MSVTSTLSPPSIIHGPATPAAQKKERTEAKAEFVAKTVEQTLTTENAAPQGHHAPEAEQHRSTKPDGSEVLITLQEDGVENKTPIPPGHSKKLKHAIANAMTHSTPPTAPKVVKTA